VNAKVPLGRTVFVVPTGGSTMCSATTAVVGVTSTWSEATTAATVVVVGDEMAVVVVVVVDAGAPTSSWWWYWQVRRKCPGWPGRLRPCRQIAGHTSHRSRSERPLAARIEDSVSRRGFPPLSVPVMGGPTTPSTMVKLIGPKSPEESVFTMCTCGLEQPTEMYFPTL